MIIDRTPTPTPHMTALAQDISNLHGPCVGCTDCRGLCPALIDALVLPRIVLRRGGGNDG